MMHDPIVVAEDEPLKSVMARLVPFGWEDLVLKKLSSTGDRRRPRVIRNAGIGIIAFDVYSIWVWLRYKGAICGNTQSPPPSDLRELAHVLEERYRAWCSAGHPPRLLEKK